MKFFRPHAVWSFGASTRYNCKHLRADFPDLTDIARESAHLLVAVEELVDFPRPVLPNVVYIGGVGMNTTSAVLPKVNLTKILLPIRMLLELMFCLWHLLLINYHLQLY